MDKVFARTGKVVAARPNWQQAVREAFEYRTEIFTAEDGSEARYSHRLMPRITVSYRTDTFDAAADRLFNDAVERAADRRFAVPVQWRQIVLTEGVAPGETAFTATGEAPWWMVPGTSLVLESEVAQEVVSVADVSAAGGSFTTSVEEPIVNSFAAGDSVCLAYWVVQPQEMAFNSVVRAHRSILPEYLALPETVPLWTPPAPTGPIYKGFEILAPDHNWRDTLAVDTDDRRDTVDFGRGVIGHDWARNHRTQVERRRYTLLSKEKADSLLHFFMRHRGMRMPFWTVDPYHTGPGIQRALSSGSILYLTDSTYRDVYADDPLFGHIWMEWPDGTFQINRITSLTVSGGYDVLVFEDSWAKAVTLECVARWAIAARFGTDRLEFDWITDGVAEATVPVVALRDDWVDEEAHVYVQQLPGITVNPAGDWSDPATYIELSFGEIGVNPDLVAAGRVWADCRYAALTTATAPNSFLTQLEVQFLNDSGGVVSTSVFGGTQFKPYDYTQFSVDREHTFAVPTTAVAIRARMVLAHAHETPTTNFIALRQREWGPNASGSKLKWF